MEFQCKQCGQCCNQFDSKSGGIMILEWEKERLEKIAKEKNIEFRIEPGQTDYDAKTNTLIISTYAFKSKKCPFLKDKKCSIHPDRPLYCRAYPLLVTIKDKKFNLSILNCPHAAIPKLVNPEKLDWTKEDHYLTAYYKSYGNMFLSALEIELFRHSYLDLIKGLKDSKAITPGISKENTKKLGLFGFLIENKFILESDADKIIKSIIHLENSKIMLGIDKF